MRETLCRRVCVSCIHTGKTGSRMRESGKMSLFFLDKYRCASPDSLSLFSLIFIMHLSIGISVVDRDYIRRQGILSMTLPKRKIVFVKSS